MAASTLRSLYPRRHTKKTPICIDLFCGAGGFSLGFCQAGGLPVAAVDSDEASVRTYRRMFPMCQEVHCGDIESWYPSAYLGDVDVMIGGPPCQGFSLARGLRFVEDPRNHLYKEFVRLVDKFRPLWVVMENVPGIINIGGGIVLRQIHEDFRKIDYLLDCKVINMAAYGVPQTRSRAIFVGNRLGQEFIWPKPTHFARTEGQGGLFKSTRFYIPVEQALGDLPWPMGKYFSHRANSMMRGPRNREVDSSPSFTLRVRGDEFALCATPAKGAFIPGPLPEVPFVYSEATNDFQRLMRENPPYWISGYEKPKVSLDKQTARLKGTRRLAVREQARLQAFPDWFQFEGNPYAQGRQIGNAVPPLFAKQLFQTIFAKLQNRKMR